MSNFTKSERDGLDLIKKDYKNILSVGISTNGNSEIEMTNIAKYSIVIATTIDEKGLEKTKKIIGEKGIDRIKLKLEDVREKNIYEDNYFDFIYARLVLHYINDLDLKEVLKEFKRILKDDGIIYIVVRSDKCDEYVNNLIELDDETGMAKHINFIGNIDYRRFHSIESISKIIEEVSLKIKSVKEYDEDLFVDYERTIPVTLRNNLIEIICEK